MGKTLFENTQHNAFLFFINMKLNNTVTELVTRLCECEEVKRVSRPTVFDDRPDWATAEIIEQAEKEEKDIMEALVTTANIMEAEHGISA